MDLDLLRVQQEYLAHALTAYTGLKALLVDSVTSSVVSHLFSMMEVAQREIYLVVDVADTSREPLLYATAIAVLHPSEATINLLRTEHKTPKFKKYFICPHPPP